MADKITPLPFFVDPDGSILATRVALLTSNRKPFATYSWPDKIGWDLGHGFAEDTFTFTTHGGVFVVMAQMTMFANPAPNLFGFDTSFVRPDSTLQGGSSSFMTANAPNIHTTVPFAISAPDPHPAGQWQMSFRPTNPQSFVNTDDRMSFIVIEFVGTA